jgi:hypothetical protein
LTIGLKIWKKQIIQPIILMRSHFPEVKRKILKALIFWKLIKQKQN